MYFGSCIYAKAVIALLEVSLTLIHEVLGSIPGRVIALNVYTANSYLLLTANLDDVEAIAKGLEKSPELKHIWRRASKLLHKEMKARDPGWSLVSSDHFRMRADDKVLTQEENEGKKGSVVQLVDMRVNESSSDATKNLPDEVEALLPKADDLEPKAEALHSNAENTVARLAARLDKGRMNFRRSETSDTADFEASSVGTLDNNTLETEIASPEAGVLTPKAGDLALDVDDLAPKTDDLSPKTKDLAREAEVLSPKVESSVPEDEGLKPKVNPLDRDVESLALKSDDLSPKAKDLVPKREDLAPKSENIVQNGEITPKPEDLYFSSNDVAASSNVNSKEKYFSSLATEDLIKRSYDTAFLANRRKQMRRTTYGVADFVALGKNATRYLKSLRKFFENV